MESKLTTLKSIEGLVLRFHVRVNTVYGQSVHISGNLPEFGNWDHEKSIKMSFEHNYDYWTVNVQLPLSNETRELEYKYLLKNESRVDLWEPERNHKITLAPVAKPAVINIEDQFQWKDNVLDAFSRATFVRAINLSLIHI